MIYLHGIYGEAIKKKVIETMKHNIRFFTELSSTTRQLSGTFAENRRTPEGIEEPEQSSLTTASAEKHHQSLEETEKPESSCMSSSRGTPGNEESTQGDKKTTQANEKFHEDNVSMVSA
jgi:hypothetical protein